MQCYSRKIKVFFPLLWRKRKICSPTTRLARVGVDRPVIFVAHSFGGLVVKYMMTVTAASHPEYSKIVDQLVGVVFYGVPHRGTKLGNIHRFCFIFPYLFPFLLLFSHLRLSDLFIAEQLRWNTLNTTTPHSSPSTNNSSLMLPAPLSALLRGGSHIIK